MVYASFSLDYNFTCGKENEIPSRIKIALKLQEKKKILHDT